MNITTAVIEGKNEFYKVEIHCPNLSPFHSIFMVRRSGIICGPAWGSFPVRGSFAVQFGDHFRSGDHLRACTDRPANDLRTGNDPQIGPQMIPDRLTINIEWNGLKFGQWFKLYRIHFF